MNRRRTVNFTDEAKAQVRKIDQRTALDILEKLDRYNLTNVGDIKKLVNVHPPELRLRVGDYRVRFYSKTNTIDVLSVTLRPKSYRDL
jgi:mRNA-degrading endonuclease RelE of RelBE toxin-antitoxin system